MNRKQIKQNKTHSDSEEPRHVRDQHRDNRKVGLLAKLIGNTGSFTFWENKKNHFFGIYVRIKMFAFLFYLSLTMESQLPQHPLDSLHNRQPTQREVK